jgi:hypothetical protein
MNKLRCLLHSMIECLDRSIDEKTIDLHLINGSLSSVLAYVYIYRVIKNESYASKVIELLEKVLLQIPFVSLNSSLIDGYTGVGWLVQHLINVQFIDESSKIGIAEINIAIVEAMYDNIKKQEYDMFYGYIGKGIYFIETKNTEKLIEIIDIIEIEVLKDNEGLFWNCNFHHPEIVVDFGLAHGIPSILLFLIRVYQLQISQEKIANILQQSSHWLISQKRENPNITQSYYPNILGYGMQSRLGWCYGDLGIGLTLLEISALLRDKQGIFIKKYF